MLKSAINGKEMRFLGRFGMGKKIIIPFLDENIEVLKIMDLR